MLLPKRGLLLALGPQLAACRAAPPPGAGTGNPPFWDQSLQPAPARRLHGRFLHITDFHPDPYYKTYAGTQEDAACHRKHGPAGVYGAETSACDSPVALLDATFDWIRENLRGSIDFVVWTGDSARHDNDERLPRTQREIITLNELLVDKFTDVFGLGAKADDPHAAQPISIPIVPTFGNNDIMPHNIFLAGPNKWTAKYLDIWKSFIPEVQRHQFQQGGWFYVEVIPGKLAVVSLNTLYFFDSNSGVDGCADKHEPGYEHMEWLRIQLTGLRERGIKVILTGHVAPARTNSKESWDETCWQKYTLMQRQFRDIIVGSLYGHMNIDHFMIQDFKDLAKDTKKGRMGSVTPQSYGIRESMLEGGEVTVASAADYLLELGDAWAKLPGPPKSQKNKKEGLTIWQWFLSNISISKKSAKGGKGKSSFVDKMGGKYAERFSVAHVSPSIVPNFFPTLRVFEYNITGLENLPLSSIPAGPIESKDSALDQLPIILDDFSDDEGWMQDVKDIVQLKKRKKRNEAAKPPKKYKFKVPPPPSKSAPPGPAYSPQTFTLKGYVQYIANLTHINNDFVTPPRLFDTDSVEDGVTGQKKWKEGKHKHHQGKRPKAKPHPKKFKFEVEYNTTDDKLYGLTDLTVRSYIDLARRIGRDKTGKKSLIEKAGAENRDKSDQDVLLDDQDIDGGVGTETKGENKGKKKHDKKPQHDKGGAWFTFVRRAFVSTMDPDEIEQTFNRRQFVVQSVQEEVMEL